MTTRLIIQDRRSGQCTHLTKTAYSFGLLCLQILMYSSSREMSGKTIFFLDEDFEKMYWDFFKHPHYPVTHTKGHV